MRLPLYLSFILHILLISITSYLLSTYALKLSSLGSRFYDEQSGSQIPSEMRNEEVNACSFASCSSSEINYGVDTSFPMHHHDIQGSFNPLNAQSKRTLYKDFMEGCLSKYSSEAYKCKSNERERINMNLNQPMSMFNYTALGFYKTRAPPKLMTILTKFFQDNTSPSTIHTIENEQWPSGNTYTNHWISPTKMLNLQNSSLIGSGDVLRSKIWDETKKILQSWTGVELSPTSLYGIRIYTAGSILAPHVDRNPLIISAIINVAQEVDEDWPLEVIGHDGKAYNISMEVGDMILYESHSVIHGRPFPLNGKYFANVFCHFEPLGYSLREGQSVAHGEDVESLESLYQQAWEKQKRQRREGGFVDLNADEVTPYYIVPYSKEGKRWAQAHTRVKLPQKDRFYRSTLTAHAAATDGDIESLMQLKAKDLNSIKKVDANGWTPLHEAVRGGHVKVASYLVLNGLDINQRTHGGTGGSPLWWAKKTHNENHPIIKFLKKNGAVEIAPE